MRAINHALTGAAIGFVVGNPWVAVPVAVASHFVCDVIPHYGPQNGGTAYIKTDGFKRGLYADAAACLLLVLILAVTHPPHWWLACVCAFFAAAPDLLSFERFAHARKGKLWRPSLYSRFASGIQWFERPIGGVVEIAWFIVFALIVLPLFIR